MTVERVKYVIWAADLARAVVFYQTLFGATVNRSSSVMAELEIAGAIIGIHSGGEGKRTWTGISFQVPDVVSGAAEVIAAGGGITREPQEEDDNEPPHLAMCFDTEGNEFMLIRKRNI
jgi:lactoylglutathione lyase